MAWTVQGHPVPAWTGVDPVFPTLTAPEILIDDALFALADDTGAVIFSGDFAVSTWSSAPASSGGWSNSPPQSGAWTIDPTTNGVWT